MSSTTTAKPDFVPIPSYIALAFIGAVVLVGFVARCLAVNHSTIGAHNQDLMIYQPAPKPVQAPRVRRSSIEQISEPNSGVLNPRSSSDDPVTPVRVQRGPRNL